MTPGYRHNSGQVESLGRREYAVKGAATVFDGVMIYKHVLLQMERHEPHKR